jgi:hypothetical protein
MHGFGGKQAWGFPAQRGAGHTALLQSRPQKASGLPDIVHRDDLSYMTNGRKPLA